MGCVPDDGSSAAVRSFGSGKMMRGELGGAASCSSSRGKAVLGEGGRRTQIGLDPPADVGREKSEERPIGNKRINSASASSES